MHRSACRRRRDASISRGFTLIEIVLVILVILILLTLTLVVVGQTMDGDRVRGAARQVQNYLAGARDRAIYAASRQEDDKEIPPAVGVRFFADPSFIIPDDPSTPANERRVRAFGSMVFVQENPPLQTWLQIADAGTRWEVSQYGVDPDGAGPQPPQPIDSLAIRAVGALIRRGLLDSHYEAANPITGDPGVTRVYVLPVYFDDDQSKEPYFVKIVYAEPGSGIDPNDDSMSGPDNDGDGVSDWMGIGVLSKPYVQGESYAEPCRFRLLPSPLPSEEPRILPRSTVIDVESSYVAGTVLWRLLRTDGSFDILFNARGVVEGPLAAAGVVNLVVADAQDVERGFRVVREVAGPGSFPVPVPNGPFVDVDGSAGWDDADGDGQPDERRGDIFIISVRTQTGSAMTSDLNPDLELAPGDPSDLVVEASDYFDDPFKYAELGGEAK